MYRRLLKGALEEGKTHIYSYELASLFNKTPSMIRSDIMLIGYTGSPTKGYEIKTFIQCISNILDNPDGNRIALAGIGNLGRAILSYFISRRFNLSITAAFDIDPSLQNKVIAGVRCYHTSRMAEVIKKEGITIGIITTPADAAQDVANTLVSADIRSILNFAPCPIHVPPHVHLEYNDISMTLEKVAFFSFNGISAPRED